MTTATIEPIAFEPSIGGLVKPTIEVIRHFRPSTGIELIPPATFTSSVKGLNEFISRAERIQEGCIDLRVPGQRIFPVFEDGQLRISVNGTPYRISDWALQQLCSRLRIPRDYAVTMLKAEKYDLFLQNFGEWLSTHAHEHVFFVRLHNGVIRGLLSEQYRPFDTMDVLHAMQQGLRNTSVACTVDKGIVTPEQINLRIVSNRHFAVANDPHYMGLRLQSSDVGQHAVSLVFFVYRMRCSNGMFFGKKEGTLFRRRHTGVQSQSERSIRESITAMMEELPNLVDTVRTRLEWAQEQKMTETDLERLVEQFQQKTTIGRRQAETFLRDLDADMHAYGGRTLFAAANVLTERAQQFDLARAEEVEQFAGELIFAKGKGRR